MSKRGNRRAALRVSMAVAAAVIAGGGAAGVLALSASHNSLATAQSAGFSQASGRTLSFTGALSPAMKGWGSSPSTSLTTISHMKPAANTTTVAWHGAAFVLQRGTVTAVSHGEFVVRSADGTAKLWHGNRWTTVLNVGATDTGMSAMTGGTTRVPAQMQMNTKVSGIARGDLVFVFGQRENHTLKAQLVLFAAPAPMTPGPAATATAAPIMPAATPTTPMTTPAATGTATMPAAPTATATQTMTAVPTATATQTMTAPPPATAPVVAPSSSPTLVTGTHF
jgi:hypothetical protein